MTVKEKRVAREEQIARDLRNAHVYTTTRLVESMKKHGLTDELVSQIVIDAGLEWAVKA